ncbi:hypothetical protein PDIDSM_5600 [Penicillium digitatum]|nr:hypothetical protein PDIDSM_5600 [Penicillium digitatum]
MGQNGGDNFLDRIQQVQLLCAAFWNRILPAASRLVRFSTFFMVVPAEATLRVAIFFGTESEVTTALPAATVLDQSISLKDPSVKSVKLFWDPLKDGTTATEPCGFRSLALRGAKGTSPFALVIPRQGLELE